MPMSKLAVLVVEDVPQVRATAVRIMEDLGCEVFDAYNGHHALTLLQAHPEIEILFADVRMPGPSSDRRPAQAEQTAALAHAGCRLSRADDEQVEGGERELSV